MHRRSLRLGLMTVLGLARRGYFIPYRHADKLPQPGAVPRYRAIASIMDRAVPHFEALIDAMDALSDDLLAIGDSRPPAPRWQQDWFPTLDAAAAYTLIRTRKPARIFEVGSGHSTRFMKRAIDDSGHACRLLAIDPLPKRGVDKLDIEIRPQTLNQVDLALFDELEAGDVLFVDSSHILMPGSDVDDLVNRVLPALPSGVLIHVHDIFLPDDYPVEWAWRGYNEQPIIAALVGSGAHEVLFASHYAGTRLAGRLADSVIARLPTKSGSFPASLWLEKK